MRTIRIKLYQFNELSNEAKQKAIEDNYDINLDQWWDNVYEDAKNIGIKITSFDIDRYSYCEGEFFLSANEIAQNIINNHVESCETYKTSQLFMNEWQPVFSDYMNEESENYESSEMEDKLIDIEEEYKKSILEDYKIILQKEYEYLSSYTAIEEALILNEYEFTKDGKMN